MVHLCILMYGFEKKVPAKDPWQEIFFWQKKIGFALNISNWILTIPIQNILAYIQSKNNIALLDFPSCVIGKMELNFNTKTFWRGMWSNKLVSLLNLRFHDVRWAKPLTKKFLKLSLNVEQVLKFSSIRIISYIQRSYC